MKSIKLLALLLTFTGLSACNSGGVNSAKVTTNATQNIAQQSAALTTFQKLAIANVTQVGKFEKIDTDNEFAPINMDNLDDISTIYVIGINKLSQYTLDGLLVNKITLPDDWIGAYEFEQDDISRLSKQINPTEALTKVLAQCQDVFTKDDVNLYAYSRLIPMYRERNNMYIFNFKINTDTRYNRCFQSSYNIDSGNVSCIAMNNVSCNMN